jgi:hypothetical protein
MTELYTPIAAAEIIGERNQDMRLQERVARYLGGLLPPTGGDTDRPRAVLMRYVARGTNEDVEFAAEALAHGFGPYWATYLDDAFTTRNPEKVDIARPPLRWAKGQKTRSWVVSADQRNGGVGRLATNYAVPTSDYQAELRGLVFDRQGLASHRANSFDMGNWYAVQAPRFGYSGEGAKAPYYYPAIMAWAALNAVFEDYDGGPNAGGGDLARFRNRVVVPAFERVQAELGITPVLVQLPYVAGMSETDLSFLDAEATINLQKYGRIGTSNV